MTIEAATAPTTHSGLLAELTLQEKAELLSGANVWETRGIPRAGVPSIWLADGPHGIRKQLGSADHLGLNASEEATCFPTAAGIASSWDVDLAERIGVALGTEAAGQNVNVLLGPGLNIKRSPLGGRNFEYFSEDPLLSGKVAASYIRGIQRCGVAATPKHFAVNSQETRRMASDSQLDERTLREIYLAGFEIAVREGRPWAIMSSYNLVNGVYAHENHHLLTTILREEWGFDGAVVSDWGGGNDAAAAVAAGAALEMPSPGRDSARAIRRAVEAGELSEDAVDARAHEVLDLVARTTTRPEPVIDLESHHALAREAAAASTVLLRNENGVLPLASGTRVAIVGDFARDPRYQGAGSSLVHTSRVTAAVEAVKATDLQVVGFAQGFRRDGAEDSLLAREAVELAGGADVVLLYLGLPEIADSEGVDRSHLQLPAVQNLLLDALTALPVPVVVVLHAGGAVEMPWTTPPAALLHAYLGGQAGAEGVLDVITGVVSPSGRLAETFPLRLADTALAGTFPSTTHAVEYREGPFVGYRHTETATVPVAYEFGFGLSYTTFEYADLLVGADAVTLTVTNSGTVDSAEVVQLYTSRVSWSGLPRPARELRAFTKVFVRAGESVEVTLPLPDVAFRHFDVPTQRWQIESGEYGIHVGSSVRDVRLTGSRSVRGTIAAVLAEPELEGFHQADVRSVSDEAWAALRGDHRPSTPDTAAGGIERNDPVQDIAHARSGLARAAFRFLDRRRQRAESAGTPDLNILFVFNMPFRAIAKMTNGQVDMAMVDGILTIVNGHFFRGVGQVIGGWVRARRADRADVAALQALTPTTHRFSTARPESTR